MKTALVTGGTGFIGRQVVPRLRDQGFEVHLVAHRKRSEPDIPEGVHVHHCDLFNFSQQRSLLSRIRPSHLVHFAWCATPGVFWTSPENLRWVQASLELLKNFAAFGGERTVFAGSCAEYDWSFGYCSEGTTPTAPRSLYGTCKNALRQIFTEYCRQEKISGGWGRIFFLYGPYEATSRLIPSVITALLDGKPAPCTHGSQIRDFLHVEDVASAFCAFLTSEVEGVVNIASGRGVSIKEVVELIADRIGRRDLLDLGALATSEAEPPVLLADAKRLAQEIDWRPTYDLSAGLDHAIGWWKSRLELEPSHARRVGSANAPGPLSS
jgi:nucleoside-diphosphate-sugar epimerase